VHGILRKAPVCGGAGCAGAEGLNGGLAHFPSNTVSVSLRRWLGIFALLQLRGQCLAGCGTADRHHDVDGRSRPESPVPSARGRGRIPAYRARRSLSAKPCKAKKPQAAPVSNEWVIEGFPVFSFSFWDTNRTSAPAFAAQFLIRVNQQIKKHRPGRRIAACVQHAPGFADCMRTVPTARLPTMS